MIESLGQARAQAHMLMSQIITIEIENMSDGLDYLGTDEHGWQENVCTNHDAFRVLRFVKDLRQRKLWPGDGSAITATRSVLEAVAELKKIQEPAPSRYVKDCRACTTYLAKIVTQIAEEVVLEAKGICLDCVKATDPTNGEQCRFKH